MTDYAKLKTHLQEMSELWVEGAKVVDVIVGEEKILTGIEAKVTQATTTLQAVNDELASTGSKRDRLSTEVVEKQSKVDALNAYLADGFKAQEAEMKRDVAEYIKKKKADGEKELEGLFSSISEAEANLIVKTKEVDVKEKRVDALEKQLQTIKDGILA